VHQVGFPLQVLHILGACLALNILHEKCMHRIITHCHIQHVWLYHMFIKLPHKRNDIREKLLKAKCVLIFSLHLPETFILTRIQRHITLYIYIYICIFFSASCEIPVILVRIYPNLNFVERFSKNPQISNFTKIRPVGDELFHANGRTHVTKPTVSLPNFANTG
jgi:small-conductance mechanosensitive channel